MRAVVISLFTVTALLGCKARQSTATLQDDGSAGAQPRCKTGVEAACTPQDIDRLLAEAAAELTASTTGLTQVAQLDPAPVQPGDERPALALDDDSHLNELRNRVVTLRGEVDALQDGQESSQKLAALLVRIETLLGTAQRAQGDISDNGRASLDIATRSLERLLARVRNQHTGAVAREEESRATETSSRLECAVRPGAVAPYNYGVRRKSDGFFFGHLNGLKEGMTQAECDDVRINARNNVVCAQHQGGAAIYRVSDTKQVGGNSHGYSYIGGRRRHCPAAVLRSKSDYVCSYAGALNIYIYRISTQTAVSETHGDSYAACQAAVDRI